MDADTLCQCWQDFQALQPRLHDVEEQIREASGFGVRHGATIPFRSFPSEIRVWKKFLNAPLEGLMCLLRSQKKGVPIAHPQEQLLTLR